MLFNNKCFQLVENLNGKNVIYQDDKKIKDENIHIFTFQTPIFI
jgi:hypothetical protein